MLIELILAIGFAVPPIIGALALYRRAHADVIWARRRDPGAGGGKSRKAGLKEQKATAAEPDPIPSPDCLAEDFQRAG